jgi:hypothetical protein
MLIFLSWFIFFVYQNILHMKKLFTLFSCLFLLAHCPFAQSVGIGTNAPNASAQLDVTATNKGILVPRLTNAQMLTIASPANGLLVYNTDSSAFAYRNATAWVFLKGNAIGSNNWNTLGNAGTNAATNFIGTTDNVDVVFKRGDERAGLLDDSSTSWGFRALNPASTGAYNTAIGRDALRVNTTGYANVANGMQALFSNTIGFQNIAIGFNSLYRNTIGVNNVGLGLNALFENTSGGANSATGTQALFSNTTGSDNVANGFNALYSNTDGWFNTAHGFSALWGNTTGYSNTALGSSAGYNNSTGSGNVFIGASAGFNETGSNKLYISNGETNPANTLLYGEFDNNKLQVNNKLGIGRLPAFYPLEIQALGNSNELVKFFNNTGAEKWHINLLANGSLNFVETNVADNRVVLGIGGEVGVGKVPLTSSSDSRLQVKQKGLQNGIGVEAANSTNHWDFYATVDAASDFSLYYNGSFKGSFDNVTGAYAATSDRRLKKDITQQQPVLNNVMQLQAYQYHYLDNKTTDRYSNGFMAQDVQKLFPDAVVENTTKDGEKRLGINYQYFTVLAIKGLQEQQQIINKQEERIAKLEAMMKGLGGK